MNKFDNLIEQIKNYNFHLSLEGYNKTEVENHLNELIRQINEIVNEINESTERTELYNAQYKELYKENKILAEEVNKLRLELEKLNK
ncbi:hypothetical protein NPA13_00145 [Mycoplasma sp. 2045]|uniref:hypothetical protein n=1 Tax=Mycoplasma sp. 2045 TaxID=2967301 RepID=UPI00211C3862|nr:hypothetical protein [Mycoplasma sp. 2045]UUM20441.1 hypothetical protein NPA13_00145 [Mycoplasma sp. 2045]